MEGSWSLGVLIGLPILGVALLILLGVVAFMLYAWRADGDMGWLALAAAPGVLFMLVAGIAASPAGYYPYEAEFTAGNRSLGKWRPSKSASFQAAARWKRSS